MIVLDTNVLLDLYRVTPGAREEMLNVIEAAKESVWIPHQVALEFHRNRVGAAKDQLDFYPATCKSLETLKNQAMQKVNEFANRCALNGVAKLQFKEALEEAFEMTIAQVKEHQANFDLTIGKILNEDPILDRLSVILDGRVGPPLDSDALSVALEEAERRKNEQIPPGFRDSAKQSNSAGDYLLWEQTLIAAESGNRTVLIVSNDEKDDWVEKQLNFTTGPREFLVEEMRSRASSDLLIMTFPSFLEAAKRKFQATVSSQTLEQARRAVAREKSTTKPIFLSLERAQKVLLHFQEMADWADGRYAKAQTTLATAHSGGNPIKIEAAEQGAESAEMIRTMNQDKLESFKLALHQAPIIKDEARLTLSSLVRSAVVRVLAEEE
ncbi:PIN domain-containing protein [Streptomyces niveus]|uniref:PIN-like domain-containing protein n=1 Tax=Streptomyces niveus TaxID=193462 RepID=UPI00386CF343